MLTDNLLHPDHVIQTAKLIAAFMKFTHLGISHMLMEIFTVLCQILIFGNRIRDAGIQIDYSHLLQCFLQSSVQSSAITVSF